MMCWGCALPAQSWAGTCPCRTCESRRSSTLLCAQTRLRLPLLPPEQQLPLQQQRATASSAHFSSLCGRLLAFTEEREPTKRRQCQPPVTRFTLSSASRKSDNNVRSGAAVVCV